MKRACVVGAGFGGLALALRLQSAGIQTNRDAILTATTPATVRTLIRDSFTEPREVAA